MLLQQRNGPATDAAIKPFNLDSAVRALKKLIWLCHGGQYSKCMDMFYEFQFIWVSVPASGFDRRENS